MQRQIHAIGLEKGVWFVVKASSCYASTEPRNISFLLEGSMQYMSFAGTANLGDVMHV